MRLDLNSTTGFTLVRRLSLGVPELRQNWLSQSGVDGAVQYAASVGIATMQIPVLLRAQASAAAMKTLVDSLNTELNRSTNIIEYQPTGWPNAYFFDTYRAPLTSLRRGEDIPDPFAMLMDVRPIVLTIPRAPYAASTVAGTRNLIPV